MKNPKQQLLRIGGGILSFVVIVVLLRYAIQILEFLEGLNQAVMARLGGFYFLYLAAALAVVLALVGTKRKPVRVVCIVVLVLLSPLIIGGFMSLVMYVGGGIS